ncbi:hypothetical protein C8P66_101232 [Humitalea rosea]|uniref:Uncharacterized protein n=1 Tax=Humitalea rosea TaxID=990373 RepID=A0A2W7IXU0_9PROT|nr:hypothetical protein [Humitalea rosea]PZW51015.1 hypothetical protein C8P66_101232 [Humitalea rosea]
MALPLDEDATVRLTLPVVPPIAPSGEAPVRHGRRALLCTICAGLAVGAGAGGWLWSRRRPAERLQAESPPVAAAQVAQPPPPLPAPPPSLDRAGLLAHRAVVPTALRWSANPLVWVLDFPSLEQQGQAMNRAAALIEKAHTPRDRVLDDAALAAAIAADRRTPATWYYGHDYRGSSLARLFDLAEEAKLVLTPSEAWVGEQLRLAMRLEPSRDLAFLTVVAEGPGVDASIRDSVLLHELGHGQFFTQPFFAAHVLRVWDQGFTEAEREAVRRFLAADGYDTAQEELMANEAMAYLLYTPDRRLFDPVRDLGWSDAQAEQLRATLRLRAPAEPAI